MNGTLLLLLFLFVAAVGLSFYATNVNWVIFGVFAALLIGLAYAAWYLIGERYNEPREIKPEHRHHHLVPLSLLVHWGFVIVLIAIVFALFSPTFTARFTALPATSQLIILALLFSFLAASLYLHWLIGGRELYGRVYSTWQDEKPMRKVNIMQQSSEGEEEEQQQPMIVREPPLKEVVVQPVEGQQQREGPHRQHRDARQSRRYRLLEQATGDGQ